MSNYQRYAMLASRLIESGSLLRLGSLRQLILGSFFVALVPLAALLWKSHSDLTKVSRTTIDASQQIAGIVSKVQQLESASVMLERSLRQYLVLRNSQAANLVDTALTRFSERHTTLCKVSSQLVGCDTLSPTIMALADYSSLTTVDELNPRLNNMRQAMMSVQESVDEAIAERLSVQLADVTTMQAQQGWLSALLVSVSLVLILLGSQLVINPVRKLKLVIRMLARQQGRLPPLSTRAPKELVGVEKDLHWLGERLAQLENIRTALLRHAAHELKTPLASIKEGCALLSDGTVGRLTAPQKEVMSLLASSTSRLNTLIEKLLDYNILLQQARASFTPINVARMVEQSIEDYQLALQQHEVDVRVNVDIIMADAELLRRILDNLLSNAVAHGAVNKAIYIRVAQHADAVHIDVANHGNTISEDEIEHLFEPFVRGEGVRNDNVIGTGLGLSIVADCARIMHGGVSVINVDYADVCFRVVIPQQEV
ncbi:sensor histidine kinase [Alteromonas gilva]|uniref:histidine kinase n=1 Tax=Alteromonas gilva TaxID=2987522 RepID=A0ABT5L3C5_9ALTE|nr:HAMP domain-containing sensor histidine kinase [Alteromonas gilva]MDC8831535.1 HAMP domain-containing sensor histidine kinase [Alteromonas gilva]